ncbi:uncharacterized protein LOC124898456 [Capsicum annuum]|uniref:uncharacterized protein LOC124898456 n=1 Tax=Capsicum annuum TaxID=4072 RepID=UPI001FB10C04|nr:uncharacterized protein LOC124898456 [Capsicum annuum]
MCWKGSVIVKNIFRGTPEHGYACLPAFFHIVELLNPRSSYSIMVNRMNGSFIYYFLAFEAFIQGYGHMRKVIVVNGTHFYGKYGGILLSVVAQDTENHIFPIAFCVIDKENNASWTFFFQKLKSIVEDEQNLCVISNRHISIANAFSRMYSRAHHELCMRHLTENLCKLKSNFPEAAHVLEIVLGFDKWSRAHFPGNRYDVMTINIAESLNSIFMDGGEYPVSYIFNSIARKFGEKFRERHAFVDGKENIFVPYTERILRDKRARAISSLQAKYGDGEGYGNSIYNYSSPIYKTKSYLLAYSEAINVVPLEAEWTVPQELLDTKISLPPYDPKLVRKKFKRTKGIGETLKSKRRNRCSICKKFEYKRTTCRMAIKS